MNYYEELIDFADLLGLEVIEKNFKSSAKGLCKGNKIGISKAIENSIEKRCVLAEEIAHSLYTTGNILDLNDPAAFKEELHARKIAYEHLLPLHKLIEAYNACQYDPYEIPTFLNVTDKFYFEAINHYCRKYGGLKSCGKYIIYFSPLFICEKSSKAI